MRKKKQRIIPSIIGLIAAITSLFPLLWMIMSGFKPSNEVMSYPFRFFPTEWTIENFVELFEDPGFFQSMGVTFVGAIIFAFLTILVNSMAAYAFARLKFPFKKALFFYCILTMFIPQMAILIPSYIVVAQLNMLNTLFVLILPGLASAMNMFLLRQFYTDIPTELDEAAVVDGASKIQIYTQIFIPLSKPIFVLVGTSSFLGYWNALIWPIMTISNPRLFQIMQYLSFFRSAQGSQWGLIMAGTTLAAMPAIILFMFFQKYLIQGIKLSGIK
ncbi:carbohydrate ABC transporter permease [Fundicoccus culcitae]|uniref:Carbohydrate ABC transporter permease n=1 Tax=Fundicoccus culcitae TaxID=2969821 RepID=A0ABY5P5B7_9LACT|nr:carbohydrate ABC transporter permease [Fundicoccus culcitae]UUX33766.1 carbohydrate ABC transporter permease [Fundicoccus culcitae]